MWFVIRKTPMGEPELWGPFPNDWEAKAWIEKEWEQRAWDSMAVVAAFAPHRLRDM